MSKPEWGTKRQCQSCGTKFYDLRRPLVTCPSCGAEVDRESPLRSRRARANTPKPAPEQTAKPAPLVAAADKGKATKELEDANLEEAGLSDELADDADDDVIEDTSELGDDDMSDVVASSDDDEER